MNIVRMAHSLTPFLAVLLCLGPLACDDSQSAGGDQGSSTDDGTSTSSTDDSDSDTGTVPPCTFELNPQGASQDVCGLRLLLPPLAVTETVTVTVTQPTLHGAVAEYLVAESKVFSLVTEPMDVELFAYATLHLPHEGGSSAVWMGKYFEEYSAWGVLDTCYREQDTAGIRTTTFGTFTVLTDTGDNSQKGDGQFEIDWGERTGSFPMGELGHARYRPSASGNRSVELYGVAYENDQFEMFNLSFTLGQNGNVNGGLASLNFNDDLGEPQSFVNWEGISPPSPLKIKAIEQTPNQLVGEISGTLFQEQSGLWEELEFTGTFEAHIARHFLPSEDPCEIP